MGQPTQMPPTSSTPTKMSPLVGGWERELAGYTERMTEAAGPLAAYDRSLSDAAAPQNYAPPRKCWTRGGLTVTSLAEEFADPGWEARGKYRALLQFIMNWNNWTSREDRDAMLDGPPPDEMPEDEKARIAAVVHCLCERDNHPIPEWVHSVRARRRGGVFLVNDWHLRNWVGRTTAFGRLVRRRTPATARQYRVWFEAETLSKL